MSEYDRIRVLGCDHLNLARGKYLIPEAARSGVTHLCIGAYALGYDREMIPAPGAMMLEGLPDMDAVFDIEEARPGWEGNTGVVIADFHRLGEALPFCGRSLLKRSIASWREKDLDPTIGIEFEAFVFQRSENNAWVPYNTPGAFVYSTGATVDPANLVDRIWEQAVACGFPIELINTEYDWPQFEFTLRHRDALAAADDAFLFRAMAREVVAEEGYLLSFMPKPLSDRGGSGFHVNLSFTDNDKKNAMAESSANDGLSPLAKQSIAGLLNHHEGLTALVAPIVNSYRRIRAGSLAGYWANWAHDHRGVTVRVPEERGEGTRLEWRLPDCAANPYIAIACTLEAARLGVEGDYALPPEETGDCLESADTDRVVPETLGLALDALAADKTLVEAVGTPLVEHFIAIKRKEWNDYLGTTTDWELSSYLDFV